MPIFVWCVFVLYILLVFSGSFVVFVLVFVLVVHLVFF